MRFVFSANNGTNGTELWVSDGTAAGTVLLKDIVPGATGSFPFNFAGLGGGKFVFVTVSGSTANLWMSDGTSGGTSTLKSFEVSSPADNPTGFTPFGSGFLFTGSDTTNGRELWTSDGTAAGTVLLSNIMSGSASSDPGGYRVLGSKVIFNADNGLTGEELWVTDGTAAGTQLLKDINLTGSSSPTLGVQIGNKLVFSANDGVSGRELWVTDGTVGGTFQVSDINLGAPGSFAVRFTAFGNKAIFMASDAAGGSEPWVTDGTGTGTMRLADIQPGIANSSIENFTVAGTTAYFTVMNSINDNDTPFELWKTDGTPSGTFVVKGMPRGGFNNTSEPLIAFGNKVVFVAYDPVNGKEVWISDGTEGGTHVLKDINPGSANGASFASFGRPIVIGDKFYFTANDGTNGNELWVSDGTAAGTVLFKNISPGAAGSDPSNLLVLLADVPPGSPTNIVLSASSVQEFRPNNTIVANLSATDPDAGDTFTFSLLNNAGGRFSISGNQLRVANGLLLDFEQASSHGVTIRVTDSTGNTFDKAFTISVTDVNPESVTGDAAANTIVGGAGADTLRGLGGLDILRGGGGIDLLDGGTEADQMTGGADSDNYFVDNALDVVIEGAGGGTADRVNTSVSYALAANQQIELFSTTNSTLTTAINLTGNNLANTILGNNGANTINGGAGIDRMTGLNGNDNYYVDNALDVVIEGAGGGTADRVLTAVNYILAADQQIELFTTVNSAAVNALNLTGNNLANDIVGNNGVNVLNGGGGIDRLRGLLGNDQYYVDNALDVVLEGVNAGTADRVNTSVSYTLAADQQIELFSTTNSAGTGSINLTGNNVANRILGNNGVNSINGGLANDVLTGGLGADKFVFNTAIAGGGNIDTIADFVHLTDDIQLAQTIFTGIGATLDATELRLGTTATTTTQRIVYDSVTGNVFFDADGSAAGAQVQFAKVTAGTVLDVNDFIMV